MDHMGESRAPMIGVLGRNSSKDLRGEIGGVCKSRKSYLDHWYLRIYISLVSRDNTRYLVSDHENIELLNEAE